MSHLILGVIGIMLAAAAALIVVNYGGDYYLDAYSDGDAMNVENAFSNVLTAHRAYEMRTGSEPVDMAALLPGSGTGVLESLPAIRGGGVWPNEWRSLIVDGRTVDAVTVTGLDEDVCLAINRRALRDAVPSAPVGPLGCFRDGSITVAYRTL